MDGIINVFKESGYTSHDVVARLRGILHTRKAGHTGTLDPMAQGVLPVCIGSATKLCDTFTDHDKEYEAVMVLGKTYDTLDVTGVILETREVMSTIEDVKEAVNSFIGGYDQVPPMYSAKKIDGKKLYELARSGVVVERKPVPVKIYNIEILSTDIPHVSIRVKCSKGTYIRSLIDDIGKKLGCGAAMEELTRTRSGSFSVADAHTLSEIEEAAGNDKVSSVIIPVESVFSDLERIDVPKELSKLLLNGNIIPGHLTKNAGQEGRRFRMYDAAGRFTGVYEYSCAANVLKPYKMFLS